MTVIEATEYLRRNKELLKMNVVAKEIGVARTTLINIVSGGVDSKGYPVKLPVRATTKLEKLIRERLTVPETLLQH